MILLAISYCFMEISTLAAQVQQDQSFLIYYFNNTRPVAALDYESPVQYKTELGF